MRCRVYLLGITLLVGVVALAAPAVAAGARHQPGLRLRFETIERGNQRCAWRADASRTTKDPLWFRDEPFGQNAKKVGIDVAAPAHPLLACGFKNGQLYYLFYTLAEEAFGGPWVVQRVRRTVRDYSSPDDTAPVTSVDHKVETIFTYLGEQGPPERHTDLLSLGQFHKREFILEFEIGFLDAEEVNENTDTRKLPENYKRLVHDWRPDPASYRKLQFINSRRWTLAISFDRDGNYAVRIPEVGVDAPRTMPKPELAKPYQYPDSRHLVLKEGFGLGELVTGESTKADLLRVLGPPVLIQRRNTGLTGYAYKNGLTFGVWNNGILGEIQTRRSFAGSTSKGIRLGDSRQRVAEVYGTPPAEMRSTNTKRQLAYGERGIDVYVDPDDRVVGIRVWVSLARQKRGPRQQ